MLVVYTMREFALIDLSVVTTNQFCLLIISVNISAFIGCIVLVKLLSVLSDSFIILSEVHSLR